MILIYDTETTGKADFFASPTASHQPHLVQIGAQLVDGDFRVRGEVNLIVKPNGWIIPSEASDVHGITQEVADSYGVPLHDALRAFLMLADLADESVAHNADFDLLIMEAALARTGIKSPWVSKAKQFCTMKAMTDVCQITGRYGFKWPTLQEAYRHCFNCEFEGAHDAMADVRACASIYQWIKTSSNIDEGATK